VLLNLTTIRRLAVVLFVSLAWTPAAYAWSWPVQGQVLRPFAYDESHPYASGQHRGVDIGVDSAGETVVSPAAGTISFAGTVPTNGRSVTIETADGYSVTLTHLGSIAVVKGATVAEEDPIGTVGPSGTPEVNGPYVHLGIRVTADPNGYVDPLGLLPPVSASDTDESGSTTSQPASTGASSAPPASKPASPAPRTPRVAHARGSTTRPGRNDVSTHEHGHARATTTDAQPRRSSRRPSVGDTHAPMEAARSRFRLSEQTSSSRRPVVEPAAREPIGLDTGHAIRQSATALFVDPTRHPRPTVLVPALCNGLPTLLALAAALMVVRSRRRRRAGAPGVVAQVLHLPPPAAGHRHVSRAA
jgi:hypothetical protein